MQRLFKQFSFPVGIPSRVAPETPGSIHEGGELGSSLPHAYGAAFDNPDLLVACVVGDGEAETGPLATSWHSNKLDENRSVSTALPCRISIYEEDGTTILATLKPTALLAMFNSPQLSTVAQELEDTITKIMNEAAVSE